MDEKANSALNKSYEVNSKRRWRAQGVHLKTRAQRKINCKQVHCKKKWFELYMGKPVETRLARESSGRSGDDIRRNDEKLLYSTCLRQRVKYQPNKGKDNGLVSKPRACKCKRKRDAIIFVIFRCNQKGRTKTSEPTVASC
eukprot:scaffold97869_cov38-Prasinocladus_malaysianus.AAC.1